MDHQCYQHGKHSNPGSRESRLCLIEEVYRGSSESRTFFSTHVHLRTSSPFLGSAKAKFFGNSLLFLCVPSVKVPSPGGFNSLVHLSRIETHAQLELHVRKISRYQEWGQSSQGCKPILNIRGSRLLHKSYPVAGGVSRWGCKLWMGCYFIVTFPY